MLAIVSHMVSIASSPNSSMRVFLSVGVSLLSALTKSSFFKFLVVAFIFNFLCRNDCLNSVAIETHTCLDFSTKITIGNWFGKILVLTLVKSLVSFFISIKRYWYGKLVADWKLSVKNDTLCGENCLLKWRICVLSLTWRMSTAKARLKSLILHQAFTSSYLCSLHSDSSV